jgi:hypothetical protein
MPKANLAKIAYTETFYTRMKVVGTYKRAIAIIDRGG